MLLALRRPSWLLSLSSSASYGSSNSSSSSWCFWWIFFRLFFAFLLGWWCGGSSAFWQLKENYEKLKLRKKIHSIRAGRMTHSLSSSRQFRSSVCLTLPHFRLLTHFLVLFCLHLLSQSLHELHGVKGFAFLLGWCTTKLLSDVVVGATGVVEIRRVASMSSFSLVTLFEIWVCELLNSKSVICCWLGERIEKNTFHENYRQILGLRPTGSHFHRTHQIESNMNHFFLSHFGLCTSVERDKIIS